QIAIAGRLCWIQRQTRQRDVATMNEMIAHHYLANSGSRRSNISTLRKEHLPVSIIAIGSCRTAVPNHTYRTGRWTSFEPRQQARRRVWSIANANLRTPV